MATHLLRSHLALLLFLPLAHLIRSDLDRSNSPAHYEFFRDLGVNAQLNFHHNPCCTVGISCEKRLSGDSWAMRITRVRLGSRNLNGFLSTAIGWLPELKELSLPDNILHGQIPRQIGNCQKLETLILKNNTLSGEIPTEIASLKGIRVLDLSSNRFSGDLGFLRNFPNLEKLFLADNLFEGKIPLFLKSFRNLRFLNLSENILHDPTHLLPALSKRIEQSDVLPRRYRLVEKAMKATSALPPASSIRGNQSSSVAPSPSVSPHKKGKRKRVGRLIVGFFVGIIGGVISGAIFSMLFKRLLNCCKRRKRKSSGIEIFSSLVKRAEDLEFLQREDGLSSLEVIGRGGCGEVYKTELPGSNGKMIAIKKIIQPAMDRVDLTEEDSKVLNKRMRQIRAEIQTVGHIRHRNLLPLLGHVCRPDCHYLVYEFMKNGSLLDALNHVKEGARELEWPARHKIAMGIAAGLEYLHMNHRPRIVHRDLKPANILLDDDMEARIADFGLAKAMPEAYSHMTTSNLAGTVGYIAPEYHQTLQFTEKCDIYSFGVVLASLVMGKLPSDEFFQSTEEMGLVKWLKNVIVSQNSTMAIDPKLLGNGFEDQMILVLKIACFCTHEDAKQRPNSKDVRCMLSQVATQSD